MDVIIQLAKSQFENKQEVERRMVAVSPRSDLQYLLWGLLFWVWKLPRLPFSLAALKNTIIYTMFIVVIQYHIIKYALPITPC